MQAPVVSWQELKTRWLFVSHNFLNTPWKMRDWVIFIVMWECKWPDFFLPWDPGHGLGHVRNADFDEAGKWSHGWSTTTLNRELTLCWHRLKGSRGIGPEEAMSADTDLVPRQQVSCSEARSRHRKFARWKRWRHLMATACSLATLACFCQIANSPKAHAGRTGHLSKV